MLILLGILLVVLVCALSALAAYVASTMAEVAKQIAHSEAAARADLAQTLDRITTPTDAPPEPVDDPLTAEALLSTFGMTDWTDEEFPPEPDIGAAPDLDWSDPDKIA